MYPPLLQLRVVPPVVPPHNVLHNPDTAQHAVDTVLRGPLPTRSGTTPATASAATTTTAAATSTGSTSSASRTTGGGHRNNRWWRWSWYRVQVSLPHLRLRSVRNDDGTPVGMTLAWGHQVELLLLLVVIWWGWSSAGWVLGRRRRSEFGKTSLEKASLTCSVVPGLPGSEFGGVSGGTYMSLEMGVQMVDAPPWVGGWYFGWYIWPPPGG